MTSYNGLHLIKNHATTFIMLSLSLLSFSYQTLDCNDPTLDMQNLTSNSIMYWRFIADITDIPFPTKTSKSKLSCTSFYFSFCKPMNRSFSGLKNCSNVGGCADCDFINGTRIQPVVASLGDYSTGMLKKDNNIVKITFSNGAEIHKGCKLQTEIDLICDKDEIWKPKGRTPVGPQLKSQTLDEKNCRLLVSVPFAGACVRSSGTDSHSQSKSHGLSTGSILVIIFFVVLIVYLFCGIVYNYKNGAGGYELIPNVDFWRELPGYIVDGAVFFFNMITCKTQQEPTYDSI